MILLLLLLLINQTKPIDQSWKWWIQSAYSKVTQKLKQLEKKLNQDEPKHTPIYLKNTPQRLDP